MVHESTRRSIEACETLQISADVQASLQQLQSFDGGQHSVFSLLLSALVVLLSRLTGDEDIAIGTRHGNQVPFVLRVAIDSKKPFSTLLADVEEVLHLHSGQVIVTL